MKILDYFLWVVDKVKVLFLSFVAMAILAVIVIGLFVVGLFTRVKEGGDNR